MFKLIPEQFPISVDYVTQYTRKEFQGNAITCTCFGTTSAWEAMLVRIGVYTQLSPRFIWYGMRGQTKSVEQVVDSVRKFGVCKEELHPYITLPDYPWDVVGLEDMPSFAAFEDTKTTFKYDIKPVRINGKEQCMRALAQGSCLTIVKVLGPSIEHCVAVIGYNEFGLKIHDSGGDFYYHAWEDLNTIITQIYRWEGIPLVPHPEYVVGDPPELTGNVLLLPNCHVYVGWPNPMMYFKNIEFNMVDRGTIIKDDPEVGENILWHSPKFTLFLPKLKIDGIMHYKVKMVKPLATLTSAEEVSNL